MATRTVFSDGNNNNLDCYINTEGKLFVYVGSNLDTTEGSFITLDKEDVGTLIKVLQDLHAEMDDETKE